MRSPLARLFLVVFPHGSICYTFSVAFWFSSSRSWRQAVWTSRVGPGWIPTGPTGVLPAGRWSCTYTFNSQTKNNQCKQHSHTYGIKNCMCFLVLQNWVCEFFSSYSYIFSLLSKRLDIQQFHPVPYKSTWAQLSSSDWFDIKFIFWHLITGYIISLRLSSFSGWFLFNFEAYSKNLS